MFSGFGWRLTAAGAFGHDIDEGPPEIYALGLYGGLKVAFDISLFRFLDLFDGFGKGRIMRLIYVGNNLKLLPIQND